MSIALSEWTRTVQPHLEGIRAGAWSMLRHVRELPFREDFETIAEEDIRKAKHALAAALADVEEAERVYCAKPSENQCAA